MVNVTQLALTVLLWPLVVFCVYELSPKIDAKFPGGKDRNEFLSAQRTTPCLTQSRNAINMCQRAKTTGWGRKEKQSL